MADDPRVQELLDRLSDSGGTPEEVCSSCADLLPVVRDRWRRMCRLRTELDAVFPVEPDPDGGSPAEGPDDAHLPAVPGYEVEAELGRGGMGVVYRARHVRLNRVVALKMVLAGDYAGPRERERFRREAQAVAALRHPNVVAVYDVGDANGRPYFTMEYVDGGSLARRLAGTPVPGREAAAVVAAVAAAVEAAHAAGVVHRDLKPSNVLLTADGVPKVSDFGLARRVGGDADLTGTGAAVGTPSYMAPEQARGQAGAAAPAADVYSLGAVLYELVTGRLPFRGETAADTVHQLLTRDPPPPSGLNYKVPRDLETVCLKCLHKEPRHRYATAAALAEDLGRFLRGEAVAARPEGRLARLARRARRRPVVAAAVAVAVVSLAVLAGGGAWTLSDRAAARRAEAADREAVERAAGDDLTEMEDLLRRSAWPGARAALERAKGRLGGRGPAALRSRLDRGAVALDTVDRLDAARLRRTDLTDGRDDMAANRARAGREFEEAFRAAGFGGPDSDPAAVAARVAASDVRVPVVAALDDWAVCVGGPRRAWVLAVARAADPDPTGWRDRARDPAAWLDARAVADLAGSARVGAESVELLVAVAARLQTAGRDPADFLAEVQRAHPADYWANHALGLTLAERNPGEAVRYFQAAVAIRPGAAVAYANLGGALRKAGRPDDAIDCYRAALRADPRHAKAHNNLAHALNEKGRAYDSLDGYARATALDPDYADAHRNLGRLLADMGRTGEAIGRYREAIRARPGHSGAHHDLGVALDELGRRDEAGAAYREAARLEPQNPSRRLALGVHLKATGRYEEARREVRRALDLCPPAGPVRTVAEQEAERCDQFLKNERHVRTLLQKNGKPASGREALFVAEMCRAWSQHRTAARFYAEGFAAEPGAGEGLYAGQRFAAAGSALLASGGPGADAAGADAATRAALRRLALGWLRAEYDRCLARRAAGLKEWQGAVRGLRTWRSHADLAGAWDPQALARLPDAERRDWLALRADVAAAAARDPFLTVEQARAYAARNDWAKAATAYANVVRETSTDDAEVLYEYAAAAVLAGDGPGHRAACDRLLAGCDAKAAGARPYLAARACTLSRDDGPARDRSAGASRDELARHAAAPWSLAQQAALLVRAGRCREAVPLLDRSVRADGRPGAAVGSWLWLALAHHRLGEPGEARRWLGLAAGWLDQQGGELTRGAQARGCHLHNWLEAQALRRELEGALR